MSTNSFTVKEHTDKYYNGFEFNTKECTVILIKGSKPNTYILDLFVCNDDAKKGLGRELLLTALHYLKEKDKNASHIILASVPHIKKQHLPPGSSMADFKVSSQKKLNKYYSSLGFTAKKEENEFEGNLSALIAKIEAMKGGRTRRKKTKRIKKTNRRKKTRRV
jgi:predicted GNAT family N-acyltransferase